MTTIDRTTIDRTFDYLRQQGVDIQALVGGPRGMLDGKEIDDIEARLSARPQGLDQTAEDALATLRGLSGQADVMVRVDGGLMWNVRVQAGLAENDLAVICRVLGVTAMGPITIGPAEFTKLRTARATPGSGVDGAMLSRVARLEGSTASVVGATLSVSVVPSHAGPLNDDDLRFIEDAYSIRPKNGVFDADCYRALLRAIDQGGQSPGEIALAMKVVEASRDKLSIARGADQIRIDVDTPMGRDVRGLMSRYQLTTLTMPDSLAQLSRAIAQRAAATPDDLQPQRDQDLLRRIIMAHGADIEVPGANGQPTKLRVNAGFTPAEMDWLETTFGQDGLNLADGRLDADDIEAIDRGMSRTRMSPTEREILLARLYCSPQAYTVARTGKPNVEVDPRAMTQADLQTAIDVYGADVSGGVLRLDHIVDIMDQMKSGGIPRGIAKTIATIEKGQTPDAHALSVLRDLLARRRVRLEAAVAAGGDVAQPTEDLRKLRALEARLDTVATLPFQKSSPADAANIAFMRRMFSRAPDSLDPWESLFEARLNSSQGRQFTLAGGKTVKVDTAGEVVVKNEPPAKPAAVPTTMDDQALHNYIAAVSRREEKINFRYDGSRYVLTTHFEDEASGWSFGAEAGLRQDGRGGSGRVNVRQLLPITGDLWVGWHASIGASYETDKTAGGGTSRHVGLEGSAGVDMRWYMSRRLGMQLYAQAGVTGRVNVTWNDSDLSGDVKATEDQAKALAASAKQKVDAYVTDIKAMVAALGPGASQQLDQIVQSELATFSAGLVPAVTAVGLSALSSNPANAAAAQQQMQGLFQTLRQNIMTRAQAALGAQFTTFQSQFETRTSTLVSDLQALASTSAKNWLDSMKTPHWSYGMDITGSVGWQARIPIVSGSAATLYFSPQVEAYTRVPVVTSPGDRPLLVGEMALGPRIGAQATVGFDIRIAKSPVMIHVGGGLDASTGVGKNAGKGAIAPLVDGGLVWRW